MKPQVCHSMYRCKQMSLGTLRASNLITAEQPLAQVARSQNHGHGGMAAWLDARQVGEARSAWRTGTAAVCKMLHHNNSQVERPSSEPWEWLCPSMHSSMHSSMHPSSSTSTHPFIHPSILHACIHPSFHHSCHPSIHHARMQASHPCIHHASRPRSQKSQESQGSKGSQGSQGG
jgi:hypothetical protein